MTRSSRPRRTFGLITSLALGLGALVACGSGDSASSAGSDQPVSPAGGTVADSSGSAAAPATAEPQRGGDIIFLESGEFTSFAQQNLRLWQNSSVAVNIFDQLVHLDPRTGEVVPWLAKSWTINDDYTEFELTLRDDVTFSDGSALTPEVVVNNLTLFGLGDPDRGYTPSRPQFQYFEKAEVTGKDTVLVTLTQTDTGFLNVLSDLRHAIFGQAALDLSFEEVANLDKAVGTGPFVVESTKDKTEVKLVRREGYNWAPESADHTGEAYLDSITYIVSSEGSSRTGLLLSGQAQAARDILITDEQQLIDAGLQYVGARPFGAIRELDIYPAANEIVADLKVRQAIQAGIDRDELIKALYNSNWASATGLLQENTPGYSETVSDYPFDADRANKLLDEAGWTEKDTDGIRIKDGQRLELNYSPEPNWVVAVQDAELIATQLGRIGIKINVVKVDPTTYSAQATEPETWAYWNHTTSTDAGQLWSGYRSEGRAGYNNPEFDALLDEVKKLPVGPERTAAIEKVERHLLDQAFIVPLQETQQSFVVAGNLQGFRVETLGRSYFYDAWLEQ